MQRHDRLEGIEYVKVAPQVLETLEAADLSDTQQGKILNAYYMLFVYGIDVGDRLPKALQGLWASIRLTCKKVRDGALGNAKKNANKPK